MVKKGKSQGELQEVNAKTKKHLNRYSGGKKSN